MATATAEKKEVIERPPNGQPVAFIMAISTHPRYQLSLGDAVYEPVLKQMGGKQITENVYTQKRESIWFKNHMAWLPAVVKTKNGPVPLREYVKTCIAYGDAGQWILAEQLQSLNTRDNPCFKRFLSAMKKAATRDDQPFDEAEWMEAALKAKPENLVR